MSMATHDLATMPYAEYLKTPHWATKRKEALDRASHRCTLCNAEDDLHVHHRTYERRGWEQPDDLIVLCKDCHERFHDVIDGKAQRTVKTTQKPQCGDGIYLFRLEDLYVSGTFADGNTRVLWRFAIVQARDAKSTSDVGKMFVAHTGHTMNLGSAMRQWAESLLDRRLKGENITPDVLLYRHMFAAVSGGRIVESWGLFTSAPELRMVPPYQTRDTVNHWRFGDGLVVNQRYVAGVDDWELSILFAGDEVRRLMFSMANLTLKEAAS